MSAIAIPSHTERAEIAALAAQVDWLKTLQPIADSLTSSPERGVDLPWRTVVLVPFAQLMETARLQWIAHFAHLGLPPRFESTTNWARSLQPFVAAPDDFSGDAARDWPTAVRMLRAAGMGNRSDALAATLCQAALELSGVAGAQVADLRWDWALAQMAKLPQPGSDFSTVLAVESRLSQIALVWVGQSRFKTDALFMDVTHADAPLQIFALPGLNEQPLDSALGAHFGKRWVALPWVNSDAEPSAVNMHACIDPADEASRCCAQINALLHQHRSVALVAQDRWLVRRVLATLASTPGVRAHTVRDETGWKLSTTTAGAQIVAVIRAAKRAASCDDVLAALKACGVGVDVVELSLRSLGESQWRRAWELVQVADKPPIGRSVREAVSALQRLGEGLSRGKNLQTHMQNLMAAMQAVGQWPLMPIEPAALACACALGWLGDESDHLMSPQQFSQWVGHVLESSNFQPPDGQIDPDAPVLSVVPLPQLLGRSFGAVVFAGAGEDSLSAPSPSASWWSGAQREMLGLASLSEMHAATTRAFLGVCSQPLVHLMWRNQINGQARLPSTWVQSWLLDGAHVASADPRDLRAWPVRVTVPPTPLSNDVVPARLSASAYKDLRSCPYRYHALHALGLREAPELDNTRDKRDMGNWLHLALKLFHEGFAVDEGGDDAQRLDACARQAQAELRLNEAAFLPFIATWPRLRDRYLSWLHAPEHAHATFERAEWSLRREHAGLELRGQLDRVDTIGNHSMVIDYKTDAGQAAEGLGADLSEDVQLAFYAALLQAQPMAPGHSISAGYLHVSDGKNVPARLHLHPAVESAAKALLASIERDFTQIRNGQAMRALGEGAACTYCAARGLCRRDFWAVDDGDAEPDVQTGSLAKEVMA